jgi:hypothetical protein
VNHLVNLLQAEIIACLLGVQAASNLGIAHLIMETDALKIKQGWASNQLDLSVTGSLMEELKSFMFANFIRCDCVYVPRECNKASHVLAALGVGSTEGIDHISCNVLDSVNVIVANDLSVKCNEKLPKFKKKNICVERKKITATTGNQTADTAISSGICEAKAWVMKLSY